MDVEEEKENNNCIINDLEIENKKILGQGASGIAYLVTLKDGKKYIMKETHIGKDIIKESIITQTIWNECKDTIYRNHVLEFFMCKKTRLRSGPDIITTYELFTKYEPYSQTMDKALGRMHYTDLFSCIAQIILTLDFLKSKGIRHMDIKLDNILVKPWDLVGEREYFPKNLYLKKAKISCILIDYGNSIIKKKGQIYNNYIYSSSEFGGKCYIDAFEIFRLFYDLKGNLTNVHKYDSKTSTELIIITKIMETFFGKDLLDYIYINKKNFIEEYGMLSKEGCENILKLSNIKDFTYAKLIEIFIEMGIIQRH